MATGAFFVEYRLNEIVVDKSFFKSRHYSLLNRRDRCKNKIFTVSDYRPIMAREQDQYREKQRHSTPNIDISQHFVSQNKESMQQKGKENTRPIMKRQHIGVVTFISLKSKT